MTSVAEPDDLLTMAGADLGATDWVEITDERVDGFRAATGDPTDRAAGFLALSLVNLFLPDLLTVESFSMGVNVGLDAVTFPAPLTSGSRVRARGTVVAASEVKGGVQVTVRVTVERDLGDGAPATEPVCVADTVSRFLP